MELAGRLVLVSGGGTGIGRGIALALARRGAGLVLVGRRPDPLQAVCAEAGKCGVSAVALSADLAAGDGRAALWERACARAGAPPDVLVHNAGQLAGGDLHTLSAGVVEAAVATNLLAPIEITRQALRAGSELRAVVLVASALSFVPLPSASVYTATKAGLHAWGASLRYELDARGALLLTVYPGGTNTAMVRAMATSGFRLADPERVGERIVAALAADRRALRLLSPAERVLVGAHRWIPGLVSALLRKRRAQIASLMAAEPE